MSGEAVLVGIAVQSKIPTAFAYLRLPPSELMARLCLKTVFSMRVFELIVMLPPSHWAWS